MSIPTQPSRVLVTAALVAEKATVLVVDRMEKASRRRAAILRSRVNNHRSLLDYNWGLHHNPGFVSILSLCALAGNETTNDQPSQRSLLTIAPSERRRGKRQTNQARYKYLFHLCSLTYVYSVTDTRFNVNHQVP